MKLSRLSIKNFLGVHEVEMPLTHPVTLFSGKNGAGKSSLQEAVRMALTGETVRVGLKKECIQLVTEGAKLGFVEVEIDHKICVALCLPAGKATLSEDYVLPRALPHVLDAQHFTRLGCNERGKFLFSLMGLNAGRTEVQRRLLEKGCDTQKVEALMPLLRSGFDAAHEGAKDKARDQKAAWRTLTGETYGEKKAATWQAKRPEFDRAASADLPHRLSALDAELAETHQHLGGLQADHKRYADSAQRLAEWREKGSQHACIADTLARDQAELKEWETKVATLKALSFSKNALPCPHCDTLLALEDGELHAVPLTQGIEENLSRLPEYEEAVCQLKQAVTNDERALADAKAAVKAIAELELALGAKPDETTLQAAREHLEKLKIDRGALAEKWAAYQEAERQVTQADERTAKALSAHESVLAWNEIADALAPEGIPGEMLAEALTPLNERLEDSAAITEWAQVVVTKDMHVQAGGRSYALLSESEKWRADAMLAEAISYLSKIKLVVLDRFDVLDLKGREELLTWLDRLAQGGEIDTALIFGTLKALPQSFSQNIATHWLEKGVIVEFKEAA
ncbi:Uncharacterized protein MCB1EB_1531 [Mycoavidus cysteinexigens]|uniref:Uncharacterized protein n=1 Tax=Mycoavidus cysteinexigens TaxID=1553431 RepID=A0A2Z6EWB3_9BURK|nr:AAA family ATPase [Mycoavidus cysteinexigens]BBE09692.1 Uncharacterized protein MCB1EB_1531 [Mycoavidus cysteinexigens]GAM51572.1 hypothetical protein EBME_0035 [bacterium endosymbiont of Mortierella elongata FMR23-6]GLR01670.1 hypothetical protein GCM10007934_14820 [Mycoavidus cysteinexigens]